MTDNIDYRLKKVNDKLSEETKDLICEYTDFFNFIAKKIVYGIEDDKENTDFSEHTDEEIEEMYIMDLENAIDNYDHKCDYNTTLKRNKMNKILLEKKKNIEKQLNNYISDFKQELNKKNKNLSLSFIKNTQYRLHCYNEEYEDWSHDTLDFINSINSYMEYKPSDFEKNILEIIFKNLHNLTLLDELLEAEND